MTSPSTFADFQRQVAKLQAAGEGSRARRLLASRTLDTRALQEFPWLAQALGGQASKAGPFRLAVLSTFTIESLRPVLQAVSLAHDTAVDSYFAPYGQLETEILDATSGLHRHKPQAVVFAWRLPDLAPAFHERLLEHSADDAQRQIQALLERIRGLVRACRTHLPEATVLLHSFVPADGGSLGIIDFEHPAGLTPVVRRLNEALIELARANPGVHIIDCERVARRSGGAWLDPRFWYRARAPLGPAALVELARETVPFIRAITGQTRKVLVTDLDNTLWGGIVGEDGVSGIRVGQDYPGNCYLAFQQELRQLACRGIVLAINSKNNEADVREAFAQRPEMPLKWEDFAACRIGWGDKATYLRELADELSLGLDSFVFIDDSPTEIEIVQRELPEVVAVQAPAEPAELPGLLTRRGYFDSLIYSAEDRRRTEFYRAETGRRELQRGAPDLESYWRSLEMKLTVYDVGPLETPRVAQLTQRTNQFNMTTRRYQEADIERLRTSGRHALRAYRLEDRFGDNGIIAVVIVERRTDEWYLDTFLMSCRVIGRTVEQTILTLVSLEARQAGARRLIGDLLPTRKNAPAREVYPMYGFTRGEALPEDGIRYYLDLESTDRRPPDWMQVSHASRA